MHVLLALLTPPHCSACFTWQADKECLASAVSRLQDELSAAQATAASATSQLDASRTLLQSRAAQVSHTAARPS
jgi:hypothetical protein